MESEKWYPVRWDSKVEKSWKIHYFQVNHARFWESVFFFLTHTPEVLNSDFAKNDSLGRPSFPNFRRSEKDRKTTKIAGNPQGNTSKKCRGETLNEKKQGGRCDSILFHFEQNSGWKLSSWKFFWSVFWQLSYQKVMDKVVGTQVVGPWLRKHPCWKKNTNHRKLN